MGIVPSRIAARPVRVGRGPAWARALVATGVFLAGPGAIRAQQDQDVEPAAEAEARCEAAVVTSIDIERGVVFDPDSAGIAPLAWAYRAMNVLHVQTQPSFIRRELLFEEGDCWDEFLVTESERLLEGYPFLATARITSEDDGNGGRRVRVHTLDEWSTQVDLGVTYERGLNLERFEATEENFLGQGVFAEFTHHERRELKAQSFSVSTPRLFGRTDASIELGRDRPGSFFTQYLRYPFLGETGRVALRQGYSRGTSYFAYATETGAEAGQIVVPAFRELIELSAARRFGELGRSVIGGVTISRDVNRFGAPETALGGDLDELEPLPQPLPGPLAEQLVGEAATRLWVHLGARRFRYVDYNGLDGLRDRLIVGLGYAGSVSVGRGFDVLTPSEVSGVTDIFGRADASFTVPVGSSLLHGGGTVEARHLQGAWRDVLSGTDLVAYLRNDGLAWNTLFLRASAAGGWNTVIPFQLGLGGREGVRSLAEDRFPGGRMVRFVAEDRIVFPWPRRSADLGLTLFGDLGRVWPGDAPFGVDSGWQAAIGAGLRVGLPAGTRHIWRADVAFPVGGAGDGPIFRVTFEFNRLARGFFTPELERSRRFGLGAHAF
jgi:hypothetical protein